MWLNIILKHDMEMFTHKPDWRVDKADDDPEKISYPSQFTELRYLYRAQPIYFVMNPSLRIVIVLRISICFLQLFYR